MLVVKSVTYEAHPESVAVYNFVVDSDHTYFVGSPNGGAWVHNGCGHHIATDKFRAIRPHWTTNFKGLFNKFGVNISKDAENRIPLSDVPGHAGPLSEQYHQWVYDTLRSSSSKKDFMKRLMWLREKIVATPQYVQGSHPGPFPSYP